MQSLHEIHYPQKLFAHYYFRGIHFTQRDFSLLQKADPYKNVTEVYLNHFLDKYSYEKIVETNFSSEWNSDYGQVEQ